MGYLCDNSSLPRPLCSRLRPDVYATDVRRASSPNAPTRRGGGIIICLCAADRHCVAAAAGSNDAVSSLACGGELLTLRLMRMLAAGHVRRVTSIN